MSTRRQGCNRKCRLANKKDALPLQLVLPIIPPFLNNSGMHVEQYWQSIHVFIIVYISGYQTRTATARPKIQIHAFIAFILPRTQGDKTHDLIYVSKPQKEGKHSGTEFKVHYSVSIQELRRLLMMSKLPEGMMI